MLQLKIKKEELDNQVWPMSIGETLVFKKELMGVEGLFGIKNNTLNFIPLDIMPEDFDILIPENLEETMGFLGSAEYLLHRLMMTPVISVSGFLEEDTDNVLLREEVMLVFSDFIATYNKNTNTLDRLKNGW